MMQRRQHERGGAQSIRQQDHAVPFQRRRKDRQLAVERFGDAQQIGAGLGTDRQQHTGLRSYQRTAGRRRWRVGDMGDITERDGVAIALHHQTVGQVAWRQGLAVRLDDHLLIRCLDRPGAYGGARPPRRGDKLIETDPCRDHSVRVELHLQLFRSRAEDRDIGHPRHR